VICLAPRVPGEIVGPRRLSGVVVRPLNFTVRQPKFMWSRYRAQLIGIGVSLLLFAATLFLHYRHDWVPLRQPLIASGAPQRSLPFQADQRIDYLIEIEADPVPDRHTVECLLGVPLVPKSCQTNASVSQLRWTLQRDGVAIALGHSSDGDGGAWGSSIARVVGTFQGRPRASYMLETTLLNDISPLTPARPRMVILGDPAEYEGLAFIVTILALIAFAIGVSNLVWLVVLIVRSWRRGSAA
jgi:hypothetical protein